jgi:hypothetical protein
MDTSNDISAENFTNLRAFAQGFGDYYEFDFVVGSQIGLVVFAQTSQIKSPINANKNAYMNNVASKLAAYPPINMLRSQQEPQR